MDLPENTAFDYNAKHNPLLNYELVKVVDRKLMLLMRENRFRDAWWLLNTFVQRHDVEVQFYRRIAVQILEQILPERVAEFLEATKEDAS